MKKLKYVQLLNNIIFTRLFKHVYFNKENFMQDEQDHFNILREIDKVKNPTQRSLAEKLGFSLGKLNYCMKALNKKGLVKISNFEKNPKKLKYIYILTPRGISYRAKLTINFMKLKMKEYDRLKKELQKK
jgi:EPS-associated MarR family transcriptional regulator